MPLNLLSFMISYFNLAVLIRKRTLHIACEHKYWSISVSIVSFLNVEAQSKFLFLKVVSSLGLLKYQSEMRFPILFLISYLSGVASLNIGKTFRIFLCCPV